MTIEEYLKHALKSGLLDDIDWYFYTMAISKGTNKYLSIVDDQYFVNVGEDKVLITNRKPSEGQLLPYTHKVTIDPSWLSNVTEVIETTIGKLVINYALIESNFQDKIPYINTKMDSGKLEEIVADNLRRDVIDIPQYISFVNSCSFIQTLSRIISVAATERNITPPEGLEEFKKELSLKYDKLYGENWREDSVIVSQFANELGEFDEQYLKQDPTYGKAITKKIKDNARKKMYLTMGKPNGFGTGSTFTEGSLLDGYPKNKEQLKTIFNDSRNGSYGRGNETQKGGAVAKELLRASISMTIEKGDCGSKIYSKLKVTEKNFESVKGLYTAGPNGPVLIEDSESLIGKEIPVRSPLYCKLEGKSFCGVCMGKTLENRKTGINLLLADVSAAILTESLKAMHNTQTKTTKVNMHEIIK